MAMRERQLVGSLGCDRCSGALVGRRDVIVAANWLADPPYGVGIEIGIEHK